MPSIFVYGLAGSQSSAVAPIGGTAALGVGLDMVSDLPKKWSFASGFKVVANSIARALTTPNGAADWAPGRGFDVRLLLKLGATPAQVAQAEHYITAECEADERVSSAEVSIAFVSSTGIATITIALVTTSGPFTLILQVSDLTVEILAVES